MTDPEDETTKRARARIGKVLREKWRIYDLIGIGGMAAVYAATHLNNGKRVAIKLLHPEVVTNAEARSRFLREGYVANKVEHPGTVQVLDDDIDDDGSVFLVMELLEGESFEARRVRSGNLLPAIDVLKVADRVLDVLAMAHEKGIVHRDIKPDNIFLTSDGGVKLLDFGIARLRDSMRRATLTSGGAIGTPAFMPPEQARGRWNDVGPRTDIWALGATMFTALTGHLVHEAETVNELLLAAMTKPAPPLASRLPGVPITVSAVVDRALAHEMDARWPDARTMQSMVRMAFQTLGDPAGGGKGRWGGTVRMPNPSGAAATPELTPQPNLSTRGVVPAFGGMMAGPLIAPPLGSVPVSTPFPMADPSTGSGWNPGMIADPITEPHRAPSAEPSGAHRAMPSAEPSGAHRAMDQSGAHRAMDQSGAHRAMVPSAEPSGAHRAVGMNADPITGSHRVSSMLGDSSAGSLQGPASFRDGLPPQRPQFASGGFSRAMTVPMPPPSVKAQPPPALPGQPTMVNRPVPPKLSNASAALLIIALGLLLLVIGLALVFVMRDSSPKDPVDATTTTEPAASAAPSSSAPPAAESAAAPTASANEPAPTASASAKPPPKVRKPVVVKKR